MSEKLVWNAILNFLNRARKAGNKSDEISRKACEFFKKDDIIKAKEILWSSAHYTNRVSIKKSAEDNINEMLKVLELCEQRNVELPVFVIVEPDEVPICPGEIAAVITRKVTEVCNKLDNFMNKDPPAPSIVPTVTETKPSYAVVLKNLPSDLTKSDLRKDFLQKMCGRECSKIVEVQPRKDNWRVVTASKADAETLVGVFQNGDKSLSATIRSPSHLGIARFVPSNINDDELRALIPKCVSSRQIGNTHSFRLKFETKVDLMNAIKNPPVIDYERIKVAEYLSLPVRCFKCQAYGHISSSCKNEAICAVCGDHGHSSSKTSPCQRPKKCALCKSQDHPCYSFKCPVAQGLLSKVKSA